MEKKNVETIVLKRLLGYFEEDNQNFFEMFLQDFNFTFINEDKTINSISELKEFFKEIRDFVTKSTYTTSTKLNKIKNIYFLKLIFNIKNQPTDEKIELSFCLDSLEPIKVVNLELFVINKSINNSEYKKEISISKKGLYDFVENSPNFNLFLFNSKTKKISYPDSHKTKIIYFPENEDFNSIVKQNRILSDYVERYRDIFNNILLGKVNQSTFIKAIDLQGNVKFVNVTLSRINIINEDNNILGIIEDISDRYDYKIQNEVNQSLLKTTELVFECNLSKEVMNFRKPKNLQTFVYEKSHEYNKMINEIAIRYFLKKDRESILKFLNKDNLINKFNNGKKESELIIKIKIKNSIRWKKIRSIVIKNLEEDYVVLLCVYDIDAEIKNDKQLIYNASYDGLTSLLNKINTQNNINLYLRKNKNKGHAFIIFDLDDFKKINDTYGHMFGDGALIAVGQVVKKMFHATDIAGRIGGDEFVVFLKDVDDKDLIYKRVEKMLKAINDIRFEDYQEVRIKLSVGISIYNKDSSTFSELYYNADKALYHSKQKGKNMITFYENK